MSTYRFGVRVPTPDLAIEPACLGASAGAKFGPNDMNKFVKLAAGSVNNNYILAADGNDIEAVSWALNPDTQNNGFSFGSVQKKFDALEVVVKGAPLAVGDAVVVSTPEVLGTVQAQDAPYVKAGAGAIFKWRVKSLLKAGTGAVDTLILIEPCTR